MELIIVIIVIAMIMSITIPRLVSHGRRELQVAADQLLDMLTMFAQREALSGRPVGIWHDADRHQIVLLILDIDEADPSEPAQWRPDRTVRPVPLPESVDVKRGVAATVDGRPVDISQWPIATEPGKPRPRVEVSLFDDDGRVKTVVLPSHALAPYLLDDRRAVLALREPVDLDAAGRHREDW